MPTYEYSCKNCKHAFSTIQKITASPLKECPACHSNSLQRGVGGGLGLHFKGSGFYLTDYKDNSNPSKEVPVETESSAL